MPRLTLTGLQPGCSPPLYLIHSRVLCSLPPLNKQFSKARRLRPMRLSLRRFLRDIRSVYKLVVALWTQGAKEDLRRQLLCAF